MTFARPRWSLASLGASLGRLDGLASLGWRPLKTVPPRAACRTGACRTGACRTGACLTGALLTGVTHAPELLTHRSDAPALLTHRSDAPELLTDRRTGAAHGPTHRSCSRTDAPERRTDPPLKFSGLLVWFHQKEK